jgi:putative DNA primase/helicase
LISKNMESLFKGYVITKDKKSIVPFKGKESEDLMTIDQVQVLPEFAGVLADDVVLVDVDDQDQAEVLMTIVEDMQLNCAVYQTTRGKHFLFKNRSITSNGTHKSLAIGLEADIKLGIKTSYAVLKHGGKDRFIEWDIEDGMEYQEIPKWLHPISAKADFFNMKPGSRNQSLYNYILTLQSNDFTEAEIKETIRIINKYVIKDPVSERELETILRDESFKKESFFKGTKFLHDKFALYLKNNYHIIRNDGNMLIYKNGVYEYSFRDIERAMVKEIPSLKNAQRKEVLNQLDLICDDKESGSVNLIPFKNGILDIETGELIPFSPDHVVSNKIPWDFNPSAYSELADQTLDKIACNDPEIRLIIEEMIGSTFYRSNTLAGGKCFILTGEGKNGKSTIIHVMNKILGLDNIAALDLKSLNERFSTVRLYKKLANIGDDISEEFNADASTFKKVVTGDRIEAEEKGQPKFEFEPYCKLIFSANVIPRIRDKTGAAQRRLLIVPFNATFDSMDPDFDPKIKYKLVQQDAIEYFIKIGIDGLKRVLQNKNYTVSEKVQKELEDYAEKNNPILSFINECEDEEIQIVNEELNKTYKKYQIYCAESEHRPLAKNEFSKQLQRLLNLKPNRQTVNGKKVTVLISNE